MPLLELTALQPLNSAPVDLRIAPAECVGLSGPSGSGKTLLLRAVADLDPHEGIAALDGRPAEEMAPAAWRRQVGFLPAESHWWADRIGDHFGTLDTALWRQVGFGPDSAEWEVTRLSTGERQRFALLRLLANSPRALLLDEPTASLDPDSVEAVEKLIANYRRERKAPVIWVSHDPAQLGRVADRQYRMEAGVLRVVRP